MTQTLSIAESFSKTPGSRYPAEGDFSGEEFRKQFLAPRLRAAIAARTELTLDLDGTAGYGTSFLEEAFGGLVRKDGFTEADLKHSLRVVSTEEPYLLVDIWKYVAEAQANKEKKAKS